MDSKYVNTKYCITENKEHFHWDIILDAPCRHCVKCKTCGLTGDESGFCLGINGYHHLASEGVYDIVRCRPKDQLKRDQLKPLISPPTKMNPFTMKIIEVKNQALVDIEYEITKLNSDEQTSIQDTIYNIDIHNWNEWIKEKLMLTNPNFWEKVFQ